MDKVYVIHEYGAPTHFYALDCLLSAHGVPSEKYELNLWGQFKKAVKKLSFKAFCRMLHNLGFLLSLPFLRPAKVVLGLAPYHRWLGALLPFLKRHKVYYFTSYTCWDGTRQVHRPSRRTMEKWRAFLRQCAHVFAVSEKTKSELVRNGWVDEPSVTVVGHSYVTRPDTSASHPKDNRFIAVGALEPRKGIDELLACFAACPDAQLTIVGKGSLEDHVKAAVESHPNIQWLGYISDQKVLFQRYKEHSFFILNSKRTEGWEELFGMALIEASACGLVPLASDHSGPCEILRNGENGLVFREGELSAAVDECIGWSDEEYARVRAAAMDNGRRFYVENVAGRWSKVLE